MDDEGGSPDIKEKLSSMTFEQLQALKLKLGSKVYNEAVFGTSKAPNKVYKRLNKNRPREISSRREEPTKQLKVKTNQVRDPRFEDISGEFDEKVFRKNYEFLDDIQKREKSQLIKHLKKEKDTDERRKIKSLLQRMNNKEREQTRRKQKDKRQQEEKEKKIQMLKEGKKPYFRSKLENKVVNLVEQYSDLKKRGKLKKHIEKHSKRKRQQDRKTGIFEETDGKL